eukprot:6462047-Amphidinium_carterae.1
MAEDVGDDELMTELAALEQENYEQVLARSQTRVETEARSADGVSDACEPTTTASTRQERKTVVLFSSMSLSQQEAKRYLPSATTITKYERNHVGTWQVKGDWLGTKARNFTANDVQQDNAAVIFVLSYAWQSREQRFQEPCPWELPLDLFQQQLESNAS